MTDKGMEAPVFDTRDKQVMRMLLYDGYAYIFRTADGRIAITDQIPKRNQKSLNVAECGSVMVIKNPLRFDQLQSEHGIVDMSHYAYKRM